MAHTCDSGPNSVISSQESINHAPFGVTLFKFDHLAVHLSDVHFTLPFHLLKLAG